MNKIKILLFIDWFLPGTKSGGPVRSYANLISHFKDEYDFYVITRNTDYTSTEIYSEIISNEWNTLSENLFVYYLSNNNLSLQGFRNALKGIDYDSVLINGIYSYKFSILPLLLLSKSKIQITVSPRGMLSPQAFSTKSFRKKFFLKFARLINLYNNIIFHATNEFESQFIKNILGSNTNVKVAPNLPRNVEISDYTQPNKQSPVRFVNVARISKEKGTLTLLQTLKDVLFPVSIDLFGTVYNPDYWEECKSIINSLPNHITVNYKGELVSEKVIPTIANYDYFVLLSEGENYGHSILEALSVGLPVIISNMTPWTNLENRKVGWDIDQNNHDQVVTTFHRAINMPDSEYQVWSNSAIGYSKEIISDEKVLKMNRKLLDFKL